ncbi:bacillithiol biosynthesis cysteine-adding enzyme BshC [Aurantibacillus circumpalustris]|uniref:bacillithiol biosynthesis cysteine-adding enzyme BshC n=1 Tax=Aurantibacillus circumpalustris TaxID=3036359 RepID=UPI00295B9899|nr:bacillithiol biosynthesis cysteine-adding enzyme BshC [Aurantibacillus circumpalustris]
MFKKTTLDFKSAGVLSSLVFDYLNKEEKLKSFYTAFPDINGFEKILKSNPYANFNREILFTALSKQSQVVANTSEISQSNISKLKNKNTFTVTTGHQLCLFTGPLYFIYKIISTLNIAESLKKKFPEQDFVPVYWMASEDHDFEEVNNFNALGKTIVWKSSQTGAVGDFKTEELKKLFPSIQELFGRSENANYLVDLFEKAYLKHSNLADATRFLVNELFGEYGIVIIDGNEAEFKHQFKEEFKKDIFDNTHFNLVNDSIKALINMGYTSQVNPRAINCFYIEEGLRTRIEKTGEVFNLVGSKRNFLKKELEAIIEHTPEKISPNVVLRPLYQQMILPNIAYVGGPGELAYWLEFKKMFDVSGVVFPILMPRNFVAVVDKITESKIEKLHFSVKDFYKSEQELIKELQANKDTIFNLSSEKETISEFYSKLLERVSAIDKTLSGSVSAELKRTLNGFERVTGKANRAIRRKYETEINQLSAIKQKLFPKNVPQERYENFSSLYLSYGKSFIREIKENCDPLLLEQTIFAESSFFELSV